MIARFLDYVELKTKITSTFAFLMTIAFLLYRNETIDWDLTGLFFVSMFLFDLATTAINNYIDTKTNHQKLQFDRKVAYTIIMILLAVSTLSGLYLAWLTGLVVFLVGGLCFLCGVFYTYGPVPISRMPLGEVLSGVFYGLLIPFLLLYINQPEGSILTMQVNREAFSLEILLFPALTVLLLSIVPTCATANIMLANNICDVEKDILVKRHTLPYYLGDRALPLFAWIYYSTYPAVILMVVLSLLSPLCLLYLLTLPLIRRNVKLFCAKQEKATTFIISIQNYLILMVTLTGLIFCSSLLN